jgi:hypothetical protein
VMAAVSAFLFDDDNGRRHRLTRGCRGCCRSIFRAAASLFNGFE